MSQVVFKLTAASETRNTCTYCSVACGILIYSVGDRAKNAVSDVGATVYAMIKYRDPPLRAGRIRQHEERERDGGYRERLSDIYIPPGVS